MPTERRQFLKGLTAGGTALIAGCGSNNSQNTEATPTEAPEETETDEPGGGGQPETTMVFGHQSDAGNLDPHTVDTTDDTSLLCFPENAYETLIYFNVDDTSTLEPHLASEVPSEDNGLITNDGKTFEFPLREGVAFHTGGEMTSEDVKFSFERAMTMNLSPEVGRLQDHIESLEAPDDYTFRITLKEEFGPFVTSALTRPVAAIVSKDAVEEHGGVQENQRNEWMSQNTAGTGPYQVGDWVRGDHITWEKFDDHWNPDYPKIDRIRQVATPEVSTRRSMLQRKEMHACWAPAAQLADLEGTPGVKFEFGASFDPAHITFNFEIPYDSGEMPKATEDDTVPGDFFQDPNVRLGFAHAFDYDAYIEQVWGGKADRMNQYHFKGQFGYDDSAPNYEYDPAKAEEYFREAGYWDEGFTITSYNEDIPQFTQGNLMLKDNIESLNDNFTLNVQSVTESAMGPLHNGPRYLFPLEFHGFLPQGTDPDAYYRPLYAESGSVASRSRAHKYVNQDIIDTMNEAAFEADPEKRVEMYHELQRLVFEDPSVIGVSTEQIMTTSLECVETAHNPAWIARHFKYWSMDNC